MPDIYIHPDRQLPKFRPLEAMRRMNLLLADKEDTEQVFHITDALNGSNSYRQLQKFAKTEAGQAQLKKRIYLPEILDDHDTLLKLPENTVGRAYVAFMQREGLTAAGLVEEAKKFGDSKQRFDDDLQWFLFRSRDTHDLLHVLSGYGRDALGETSLLAFTHGQHGGRGLMFIAYMGTRQMAKTLPNSLRLMDVFHEGRKQGKLSSPLIYEDIETLLREPLEDARKRMNILPPVLYQKAIAQISEIGNAHEVLAAA